MIMMKIVFYKGYEFLELIDSYFAKFDGAPNFVVVKEEDINSVMFRFENSQIEFNNPNSNSCFIKGNNLKRILQAIIYFCENDFTPRYFFEILS